MVREAVEAGADIIMLDNMTHDDMAAAIELIAGRAKTECSATWTPATFAPWPIWVSTILARAP